MKRLILFLLLCIALIFSSVSCGSNKSQESEMEIKAIDPNNAELNYLFNLLEHEAEINKKVDFSIIYQDLHYQYKESHEYDGEYWLSPSLSLAIGLNFKQAANEDWYKACPDKELKTLNSAFFNEYCKDTYEGEVTLFGVLPRVGFRYDHTEETISEAIRSFSKDYLALKRLAELPCVDRIYIKYSYSVPGAYFEL